MKLKNIFYSLIIIFSSFTISNNSYSQCKNFSVNTCKPALYPYIHDGIYNAHVLTTGESAELFKTFFSHQNYRMVICKPENLPQIDMQVFDTKRNIIYSMSLDKIVNTWDFKLESSQQLIISLNVKQSTQKESGCVSILIGLEDYP